MSLVGENVALLVGGLASHAGVRRVVFGGATLPGNETLRAVLTQVSSAIGLEPILLDEGGYAGALGARGYALAAVAE